MDSPLGTAFSRIDALKRQLYDMLTNPRDAAAMLGGRIVESGQQAQALQEQTFGDPNRPFRVTDPQAMARLTDMLMAGPMGFAPAGITAYHGSPYLFRQFDPSKVGTGEGAQAYGVGAGYTAESRGVAEGYREGIKDIASIKAINKKMDELIKVMDSDSVYPGAYRKFKSEKGRKAAEEYDALMQQRSEIRTAPGYLYKGDIPDEILPKFLDWDKPVNKQPNVMDALRSEAEQRVRGQKLIELENEIRGSIQPKNMGDDFLAMFAESNIAENQEIQRQALARLNKMDLSHLVNKEMDALKPKDMNWNMTGKEFYEYLARTQGSADRASALLERQGVRGIRYLDQGSRGEGKGTSNFVPFRPEDFKIEEINDLPLQEWINKGLL